MKDHTQTQQGAVAPARKPYEAPVVRRAARVELITAGSFDLVIPNA